MESRTKPQAAAQADEEMKEPSIANKGQREQGKKDLGFHPLMLVFMQRHILNGYILKQRV